MCGVFDDDDGGVGYELMNKIADIQGPLTTSSSYGGDMGCKVGTE